MNTHTHNHPPSDGCWDMYIRIVKEVCVTLSQSLLGIQIPGPMTTIVYHAGETIALLQEEES